MDIKKFFTAIPCHAQTLLRVGTTPDSNVEVVGEDVKEKTEKRVTSQTRLPILPPVPYQPRDVNCMPVQRLAKRTLCFQRACNLKFRSSNNDVVAQLSTHHLEEQTKARNALLKIVTTVQYLAQQGLAIRGKESSDGNFMKLLELRSNDDVVLQRWLTRTTSYTSVAVQNELLKIMAHMVLRNICKNVGLFAVIVDGTQDIQGVEQEAICVRYIDDAYDVHEDFIGVYSVSETTGASLSNMLQDALLRLNLPITHLRAQTYDGASNMSGKYQGCQALIKKVQPLANYTHCGAHITHLICAKAIETIVP
ncbi:zinc finger MYM-type protein 1-like [Gigantopelta aegis]|uniref:zinc finger MYM-type protein 1-like n=1 Tax=Gigantopelta aegis TaxID=1735272 RepID=UPI001B88D7F4|nr:zinc finger MYM-type protein 1-like [Gigantopelta aegis]